MGWFNVASRRQLRRWQNGTNSKELRWNTHRKRKDLPGIRMLKFIQSLNKIEVRREFSGDCICLFARNYEGEYEPHFQTSTITPDELHQVADKLEELSKK